MELNVTTAISLSIERYNELIEAEPYKRLMDRGFVDVTLVSFENSIRLCVPGAVNLGQVANAAAQLMPIANFGGAIQVRTADGLLLECNRPIAEYGLKYGERLFIETGVL